MRILLTNDDGINAPGILALAKWAMTLGEVTVVAPKIEQSGKSHGIEIVRPMEIKKVDFPLNLPAYAVDSTPADCVRLAILGMHEKFDMVISGINKGLNIGCDIMYSGTVGAVFEAYALGVPYAMALSTEPKAYEGIVSHMDRVWQFVTEHKLFDIHPIYNINIPAPAGEFRFTRQGSAYYSDDFAPEENDMYLPCGKAVWEDSGSMELDTDAVLRDGCISVMPLTICRADLNAYDTLKKMFP